MKFNKIEVENSRKNLGKFQIIWFKFKITLSSFFCNFILIILTFFDINVFSRFKLFFFFETNFFNVFLKFLTQAILRRLFKLSLNLDFFLDLLQKFKYFNRYCLFPYEIIPKQKRPSFPTFYPLILTDNILAWTALSILNFRFAPKFKFKDFGRWCHLFI